MKRETLERMEAIEKVTSEFIIPVFTVWRVLKAMHPNVMELDTHHPYYRVTLYALNKLKERGYLHSITTHNNDTVWYIARRWLTPGQAKAMLSDDDIPF